jgi:hypothetical protein
LTFLFLIAKSEAKDPEAQNEKGLLFDHLVEESFGNVVDQS